MLRISIFCLFTFFSLSSFGQLVVSADKPEISIESPTFDFGDIIQGDKVEHMFKFTNTGKAPLVITNVQVTCGCTTPKGWPRDPIGAGERAELTIAFNSAGKLGKQNKVVTIVSNAPGTNIITFTANVLEKPITNNR